MTAAIVTTIAVVGAAAAGVGVGHAVWDGNSSTVSTAANNSTNSGANNGNSGTSSNAAGVAQTVDAALVDINSTFSYQSAEGAGTGIVLTSTGEILTNNHVVNGATSISVTDVGNGKTYSATVVGYDDSQDIAVLQLQGASGLTTADIGNSSSLSVGQAVTAIGNAGGTGGTPTSASGSVTALDQSITASDSLDGVNEQLSGLIEVNADVQAGDSGGSLVNSSGQVVGIDTAGSSSYSLQQPNGNSGSSGSGTGSGGDGFAIPINTAISIAQQIEAGQSSSTVHVGETAFLGVMLSTASGRVSVSGAQIAEVVSGGAAAQAGLTAGDVITSLNGQSVSSASDLSTIVGSLKPGQSVSIGYTDTSGQSNTATVTLASGPPA
ncbi:S1C family serine protease [Actinospica sp.]|uniref:S1C family serine protease n=1 Tax=Actinospica sp. TaxID=1872142 RepID=UPI002C0665B7|nr:trypsin-like peptidase domain-containing protein [Actinospica sp.]HWG28352.1 trypsin-like peptidase domain-containing protein [Actinospica sp.]